MEPIMRILEILEILWNKFQSRFPYFKSKEIPIFYFSVESNNCPSEHISLYSEKATKIWVISKFYLKLLSSVKKKVWGFRDIHVAFSEYMNYNFEFVIWNSNIKQPLYESIFGVSPAAIMFRASAHSIA